MASASATDDQETDVIDEAFMAMGGFGRLQKFSYLMNTLTQGAAAFFVYCFVFLEKQPKYECLNRDLGDVWEECEREHFCAPGKKVIWRVDWEHLESIHNLIEQLNWYCEPDYMIGLVGAFFLLGIVVGCSTLARLGDIYGRKPIYLLGLCMHLSFMFGILISKNAFIDYFLLFTFGMSITARYYVGYTYNLEMQPKSHYVLVSTTMFIFESFVYLFICLFFRFVSDRWQYLQIPNVLLSIMGMFFLCSMPESPRFLISVNRFSEARQVFKWIGIKNGLKEDVVEKRMNEIVFDGEKRMKGGEKVDEGDKERAAYKEERRDEAEETEKKEESETKIEDEQQPRRLSSPDKNLRSQMRTKKKMKQAKDYGASFNLHDAQ